MKHLHIVGGAALLLALSCSSGPTTSPVPPAPDAGADAKATGCPSCGEKINATEPGYDTYQASIWQAYAYVPSCSFDATRLAIRSNSQAVGLLGDAAGMPGPILVDQAPTQPAEAGWRVATFPLVRIVKGQTYYIAIKNTEGGMDRTLASVAKSGTGAEGYAANGLGGPWNDFGAQVAFVFGLGSSCL